MTGNSILLSLTAIFDDIAAFEKPPEPHGNSRAVLAAQNEAGHSELTGSAMLEHMDLARHARFDLREIIFDRPHRTYHFGKEAHENRITEGTVLNAHAKPGDILLIRFNVRFGQAPGEKTLAMFSLPECEEVTKRLAGQDGLMTAWNLAQFRLGVEASKFYRDAILREQAIHDAIAKHRMG